MMTYAYPSSFVGIVEDNLGGYFDAAIRGMHLTPAEIQEVFISSHMADEIQAGNPKFALGMSSVEMIHYSYRLLWLDAPPLDADYVILPTPEYWAGMMLAYLQWHENISFASIFARIPFQDIVGMYIPFHEASEGKFIRMMRPLLTSA